MLWDSATGEVLRGFVVPRGITVVDADTWTYSETTMLQMAEFPQPFAHTDHNTMRRVS